MDKLTVSTEVITVAKKREIGILIEAIVSKSIERADSDYPGLKETPTIDELAEITSVIKRITKLEIPFKIIQSNIKNASAWVINLNNTGGSGFTGLKNNRSNYNLKLLRDKAATVKIDLVTPKIIGKYQDELTNRIDLTSGLFNQSDVPLNSEEITAIIMHELGHIFSQYITIGDSVWVNYILQDGCDVLLGKKPNKYQLEVLSRETLIKIVGGVDPDLMAKLVKEPTAENYQRALLMSLPLMPRPQLTSETGTVISKVREEQFADLFASRMGYSRALVTALHKMEAKDKFNPSMSMERRNQVDKYLIGLYMGLFEVDNGKVTIPSVLKNIAGVLITPFALAGMGLVTLLRHETEYTFLTPYDHNVERYRKMRNDAVAQLRVFKGDLHQEAILLHDIKIIDEIIRVLGSAESIHELFYKMTSGYYRKNRHQFELEEQLERLMSNDLYVAAAKYNQLLGKKT